MNTQHKDTDANFATIDDIINFYSNKLQTNSNKNNKSDQNNHDEHPNS
jgi:hypothetical protein